MPFGAGAVDIEPPSDDGTRTGKPDAERTRRPRRRKPSADDAPEATSDSSRTDGAEADRSDGAGASGSGAPQVEREESKRSDAPRREGTKDGEPPRQESARQAKRRRWQERRRSRRGRRKREGGGDAQNQGKANASPAAKAHASGAKVSGGEKTAEKREVEGLFLIEKSKQGAIRLAENDYLSTKQDVHVSTRMIQKLELRPGSMITGTVRRGQGRHKWDLADVTTIDGESPSTSRKTTAFKALTSIDPDFHYAVGDLSGVTSLKVIDILAPIGRGQRGLIVSPPRAGKTILLQAFAKAIEKGYPEVHLMILLVDERPEEATEWKRTIERGTVYVSTNDEPAKKHVDLAEIVWARCKRLVELGEDVVLLMDSITRLGRAYNNVKGDSGRTMSGGLDTRALERPKQFFGAARNTETAGSLTILGTTLIETGSRMDQVIFEEFKGTGNMELVLSRKLADRRIFPAIDIVKTGTRKEEKLHSRLRLGRINTLRRVLLRMHWAEAMELLSTKLDEVEKIDDFLERFDIDPEA